VSQAVWQFIAIATKRGPLNNGPVDDPGDDAAWLAALQGRPLKGTDAATLAEAESVRKAILESESRPEMHQTHAGLQQLLFRLRRERLLDTSSSQWKVPAAAVAALFVGVLLTFTMLQQGGEEGGDDIGMRGGSGVQVLSAADVGRMAGEIEAVLRNAGATVVVTTIDGGGREVAATIPANRVGEVQKPLATLGVSVPRAGGALRVEVRPVR
jgi:hypothetical protein